MHKHKGKKLSAFELKIEISKYFRANPSKKLSAKHLGIKLQISNNKDSIRHALDQLKTAGELQMNESELFFHHSKVMSLKPIGGKSNEGKLDVTQRGDGFVIMPGTNQDIFVPARNLAGAMNGDTVRVEIVPNQRRGRPEGRVVAILERGKTHFMGKYFASKKAGFVIPDRVYPSIRIDLDPLQDISINDGEIVVIAVKVWPEKPGKNPIGVITEVLGQQGSSDIDMKGILIDKGFELSFDPEVEADAAKLSTVISPQEIALRRDMREITTFTIDPYNAKDFDDAISFQILPNGHTEIGVHIADVSHYIQEGTLLDQEAYKRSTSVYLVDRVSPMLPEKLSNELCSLRPNEDKLTFSAIFEFNKNDKVVKEWFGKTIIHSDRRFSYEEAQVIIEEEAGDYTDEIKELNRIALALRKERFKNGSINFETEEVQFKLDEHGVPLELYVKERKAAHMLIEDFMLLANKQVATYVAGLKTGGEVPFVYRIHDFPDPSKLADFALFAAEFGIKFNLSTPGKIAQSFNDLVVKSEENEVLKLLLPLAIRTMAKAEYSTNNIGHYGLAFEYYSHFTSPIRRYSDVLAHRILARNLGDTHYRVNKEALEQMCKHISAQERKAMEAERESIKYKQVEYMSNFVGQEFDGVISGMIERGVFVTLKETKCEGMVPFDRFPEPYTLDDSRLKAVGRVSRNVLKMGDSIRVRVLSTDIERRTIELGGVFEEMPVMPKQAKKLRY